MYCLWDIFGLIDCTIDQISVLFLGAQGVYEGAARKPECPNSQQAFYSGYAQHHGFKILTILTWDGLSPCMVLSWQGTMMLHAQHVWIKQVPLLFTAWLFCNCSGGWDKIFNIWWWNIQHEASVHLVALPCIWRFYLVQQTCQLCLNLIENNYDLTSSPYSRFVNKEWNRLAKKAPYAFEQLRISHLLINYYVCCNRDQTGLKFGLIPPSLHVYLGEE